MKKVLILALTVLAVAWALVGMSAHGDGGAAGAPSEIAREYLGSLRNQEFATAYSLTAESFQDIIPYVAFAHYHQLGTTSISGYEVGNAKTADDGTAQVPFIVRHSGVGGEVESPGMLKLARQGDEWRVQLDWEQYYSTKISLLPALATFERDGITVQLKPIVLNPASEGDWAYSEVRLDITNASTRELRWDLPTPGTEEGYLRDTVGARTYHPSYAYGVLADMEQDFHFIPGKSGHGTILMGPNTKAAVFVHIPEVIPATAEQFDLFLDGLSFLGDSEDWGIVMNGVPARFEVVPAK